MPHVARLEEGNRLTCLLDDVCFDVPSGYVKLGPEVRAQYSVDEEDDLLQIAIQQSLLDSGGDREVCADEVSCQDY